MNSQKPLSVLHVCTSRSWGGMEMRALQTSLSLQARGLRVTLLCFPNSTLHREAQAAGIGVFPAPFRRALQPLLILRLRRFLRARRFDLMHTHFSKDLLLIVPAAEGLLPRLPIVLTKRVGSGVSKKDFLHRYLYSRVDLMLAISRVIRDNVIATCPIDAARVEILYNGVALRRFTQAEAKRNQMRAALGLQEDEVAVGMVGRMSPGKGHEEFLFAAKQIAEDKASVRFVVVGGASYGEEAYAASIERLREQLQLTGQVMFTGFRQDVAEMLAAMDIVAVPSHAEAFGNVAVEAMAAGKPVVATNCDGIVDIVVDGVTGIQVPPKNGLALATGLRTLIDQPALRKKLGAAGRRRVEEMFDDDKQTAKLLERYHKLIEAARSRNGS